MEPTFHAVLADAGCTHDEATNSVARLKDVFLKHSATKSMAAPDECKGALLELRDWYTQMMSGLMFEILMREVELYRLRGEGG